jgi:glycosyltransferase involved in cell wall biosynthesis
VHPPERELENQELDALADEAIPIYGAGGPRLLADAWRSFRRQPIQASRVLALALRDAVWGRAVPLSRRPKLLIQCLAALALDQRTARLPLVHVHAHMAHVPTSIAMYLALLRRVPFSFTGHAADLFCDYALLPDKLRRAAFVACISHWHREYYRQWVPELTDERLPLVRCGVETDAVGERSPSDRNPAQILAVGRLVEKKGFDVLIRALAGVRQQGVDFACRLVGDGPELQRLMDLIQQLGMADKIRLEGARSNQTVRQWMQQADLFVLPCQSTRSGDRDGIPVVLMEAMAAEVPVISGDLPTIRELVQHGQNGWLVPPGRVEPLREAILQLMHHPGLRQQLAAAGRRWVEVEFSQAINIDRLSQALALDEPCGQTQ